MIYNNNNLVLGDLARPSTTGQLINASNILKHGGGSLFIDAPQTTFNGNYIINQGAIFLRENTTAQPNLGGVATLGRTWPQARAVSWC